MLSNSSYHLKHNSGHGMEHPASLLASLNVLVFLHHTFLSFCDEAY